MKKPVISIVMPLFNKQNEVLSSINSVLAQSVDNWELIVVDDGSTDQGPNLVLGFNDSRIRLFRQHNSGVSEARNQGVALASCDLIAFLDADDVWKPGFLFRVLSLVQDFPSAQWFALGYEKIDSHGRNLAIHLNGAPIGFSRGILSPYFTVAIKSDPPVCSSSVAITRSALKSIGGFPAGINSGEDLLTWARLALRYKLAYEVEPQVVYMVSGISRQPDVDQRVSHKLLNLLKLNKDVPGLSAYVGLWFRMQSVMFIQFNNFELARECAWKAFRYGPWQWRNFYILVLSVLPSKFIKLIDKILRRIHWYFDK